VNDDSEINEAFAVAVETTGVRKRAGLRRYEADRKRNDAALPLRACSSTPAICRRISSPILTRCAPAPFCSSVLASAAREGEGRWGLTV
jgi:predicted aminopeptidase